MIKIKKRTFKALEFPEGSEERDELNEEILTSKYQPSYKYVIECGQYQLKTCKTLREAKEYIK